MVPGSDLATEVLEGGWCFDEVRGFRLFIWKHL